MIYVKPGDTFVSVLTSAEPGQAGDLQWRLEDTNDQEVIARSPGAIVEFAVGSYRREAQAPATSGTYFAIWDDGTQTTEVAESVEVAEEFAIVAAPGAYDPDSDVGKVRLLISDVGGDDGASFIFSDVEIENFLSMRSTIRRAAATALRTMAGNEAMIQKVITWTDLQTDGAKLAEALRKLAADLEKEEDEDTDDDVIFDWAEMGVNEFSRREMRANRRLKEYL